MAHSLHRESYCKAHTILPLSTEDNLLGIRLSHYSRFAKLIPKSLGIQLQT